MAYTFKRLAEVEEIQEAPETAKAFVEVNGEVKRAPYGAGGGVNLDELRFNLDVEEVVEGSTTYISFTNMEQIKKVLDNDMNIVAIAQTSGCGGIKLVHIEYLRCNTTSKTSGSTATIPVINNTNSLNSYLDTAGAIAVEFESEERLVPISARFISTSSRSYLIIYATI